MVTAYTLIGDQWKAFTTKTLKGDHREPSTLMHRWVTGGKLEGYLHTFLKLNVTLALN